MSRSTWKGAFTKIPTIQSRRHARAQHSDAKSSARSKEHLGMIKIWSRAFMITPSDLSQSYLVYSGKRWVKVRVTQQMIGHRFGEFCTTRQATVHKVYKQKQTHRKSTFSASGRKI